jgi:hypothetical protein
MGIVICLLTLLRLQVRINENLHIKGYYILQSISLNLILIENSWRALKGFLEICPL